MELSGKHHGPIALPPGRELPIARWIEAGWAPDLVWTFWNGDKSLASSWNRTAAVRPVSHRCYDNYPGSMYKVNHSVNKELKFRLGYSC
jgi:hypothetical protein